MLEFLTRSMGLALLVAPLLAGTALAAEEPPTLGLFIEAKPIVRRSPSYPPSAQSQWKEGWVLASFCVDATGNVREPVIERSSGAPEFERQVLRALPRWKYEPARLNGAAVEHCEREVRFAFSIEGHSIGARPVFIRSWKAAMQLIEVGDVAEARAQLAELKPWNNYESARLALARAQAAQIEGKRSEQLRELHSALSFAENLEKPLRAQVRRHVFALEVNLEKWASALETYADLQKEPDAPISAEELRVGEELVALVASDKTLGTNGELACRCAKENGEPLWAARLLRREFGFSEAAGKIDRFEVRCETHRFTAKFETGTNWTLPESWGRCSVYVYGEEGATFRLLEAPAAVASEAPASAPAAQKS